MKDKSGRHREDVRRRTDSWRERERERERERGGWNGRETERDSPV